jgi:hypothetical protein
LEKKNIVKVASKPNWIRWKLAVTTPPFSAGGLEATFLLLLQNKDCFA